MVAATNAERL